VSILWNPISAKKFLAYPQILYKLTLVKNIKFQFQYVIWTMTLDLKVIKGPYYTLNLIIFLLFVILTFLSLDKRMTIISKTTIMDCHCIVCAYSKTWKNPIFTHLYLTRFVRKLRSKLIHKFDSRAKTLTNAGHCPTSAKTDSASTRSDPTGTFSFFFWGPPQVPQQLRSEGPGE
jgi:hypothetical protein